MSNADLARAKRAKEDEFYTTLSEIEGELNHYKKAFEGKTVFCNCDDPYESNFFKYFAMNFNYLGLKKLIAMCYVSSPMSTKQLTLDCMYSEAIPPEQPTTPDGRVKKPYKIVITEVRDINGDGAIDLADVEELIKTDGNVLTVLKGDGDFRSEESINCLQESDIVVTNPPFSLFKEFISQLIEYKKQFIIIGNQNAITYKDCFKLLMDNCMWIGYHFGDMKFTVPDYYEPRETRFWIDESGQKWRSLGNACWFTNIDIAKRHEPLILYKKYDPEQYPKYENYNAINVNKVSEIPIDYYEMMGVPLTFMDKYCPDQFEICGMCENLDLYGLKTRVYSPQECKNRYQELFGKPGTYDLNASGVIDGKKVYQRILIKRRPADGN